MTGFRIGWVIGPETIINAIEKVQSHTTSGASVLLQEGALGAFDDGNQTIHDLTQLIQTNRDILVEELKKIRGIKLTVPKGTFYCFPDFRAFEGDSQQLARLLLEKAYLATVPGVAFGREGFLRISFSCSTEQIRESVKRIRWAIDPDAPNEISIGGKIRLCEWDRKRVK
jgi:aspartate aminotransferase